VDGSVESFEPGKWNDRCAVVGKGGAPVQCLHGHLLGKRQSCGEGSSHDNDRASIVVAKGGSLTWAALPEVDRVEAGSSGISGSSGNDADTVVESESTSIFQVSTRPGSGRLILTPGLDATRDWSTHPNPRSRRDQGVVDSPSP
jgi:hypothetical protein